MRIALCSDTFFPEVNGVANAVQYTARALASRGHQVGVFVVSKLSAKELRRRVPAPFSIETIPSIGLPIYLGVRVTPPIGFMLSVMKRFKPDVIHTHTPFSVGWESVWASRALHVPLIGTHHTFFNHYLKHVHLEYGWAERLSWKLTVNYYNRCDLVVCPTHSLIQELMRHGLKRPTELLPNSVDAVFFAPPEDKASIKKRLGLSHNVLMYMGRLSYEKSIDQVIRVFALITKTRADAMLVIVGDGPERTSLEKLSKSLGLRARVRFTGFLHDEALLFMLQAADVFVTMSKSENMPLSILEGMAVGLPIVAVRSLGMSEMIEHERNGFLLPPDDVAGAARATTMLFQDENLRKVFGSASRAMSERYSESAIATHLESSYAKLMLSKQL